MGEPAISVEELGKRYRIGAGSQPTCSRERLQRIVTAPLRAACAGRRREPRRAT